MEYSVYSFADIDRRCFRDDNGDNRKGIDIKRDPIVNPACNWQTHTVMYHVTTTVLWSTDAWLETSFAIDRCSYRRRRRAKSIQSRSSLWLLSSAFWIFLATSSRALFHHGRLPRHVRHRFLAHSYKLFIENRPIDSRYSSFYYYY